MNLVTRFKIKKNQTLLFLLLIFCLALVVRFWWFPKNVYFGYDQARDAFVSQEIYQNKDLKIIGPSAGKEGLFHGPLYWYLIGPVYLFFKGNPAGVLAFISFINCLGIFLIYFLGKNLFGKNIGLIAALFFAFSFSQSQYALYFANPAPAVLTIILIFLGWALLIFKKKKYSWVLIGLGYGLSVQFEFFLIYLILTAPLILLIYRKEIMKKNTIKNSVFGLVAFLVSVLTFIVAELKYNFRTTRILFSLFSKASISGTKLASSNFWGRLGEELSYGIFTGCQRNIILTDVLFLLIVLVTLFIFGNDRKKLFLPIIWIFSNLLIDFFGSPQLYYVSIGMSVALILIYSYCLEKLIIFNKFLAITIFCFILGNNFYLIKKFNKNGPLNSLYVQEDMLLEQEKGVLDKIYLDAEKSPFIVNALTMPYKIKTTWAYLFNWYGQRKYGYVPFWGGENVPGYAGELPLPDSDKYVRYAIFEPMRGIPKELKKEFLDSENGYGLPLWEERIGDFIIQKRIPNR